jgi:hypothetical protein
VRDPACLQGISEAERPRLDGELLAHAGRRGGVAEQHGSETDGDRPGGDELERVAPGLDTAEADDRQTR